ncbi:hypothetical protein BH11ACT8_BH11ACT8_30930 [soil metagenome]
MTGVCLSMIVKDEAHCIEECLASVLPLITRWVVVDTGSTDGTQDLVRSRLAAHPDEPRLAENVEWFLRRAAGG